MVAARFERADDCGARRRVAERDGDVAEPAFIADAANRAAFRLAQKHLFAPCEQRYECGSVELMARCEVELARHTSELVPWAYELTVIAAVDAIADRFAKLDRDRAAQLDREIRDRSE